MEGTRSVRVSKATALSSFFSLPMPRAWPGAAAREPGSQAGQLQAAGGEVADGGRASEDPGQLDTGIRDPAQVAFGNKPSSSTLAKECPAQGWVGEPN